MYASCRCSTGHCFDAKIVKFGWIHFGRVRWVSSKIGHFGPIEGPFCGIVTF